LITELRIERIRRHIANLRFDATTKDALYATLEKYRDQILARPLRIPADEGWDDIEALHQVALGDAIEAWFERQSDESENCRNQIHEVTK